MILKITTVTSINHVPKCRYWFTSVKTAQSSFKIIIMILIVIWFPTLWLLKSYKQQNEKSLSFPLKALSNFWVLWKEKFREERPKQSSPVGLRNKRYRALAERVWTDFSHIMQMKIMLQILTKFLTGILNDNVTARKLLYLDLRSRSVSIIATNSTYNTV